MDLLIRWAKLQNDSAVNRPFLVEPLSAGFDPNKGRAEIRPLIASYEELLCRSVVNLPVQIVTDNAGSPTQVSCDQPLFDLLTDITDRLCHHEDLDLVRPRTTLVSIPSRSASEGPGATCPVIEPIVLSGHITPDVPRLRFGLGFAEENNESCEHRDLEELLEQLPSLILASRSKIGIASSGTTGKPKWIYHRMDTLARSVKVSAKHRNDVWGLAYSPDRFAGVQVYLQAICNLNTIVSLLGLPPDQIHDAIEEYGITHLSATPTLFRLLMHRTVKHEKVRAITVGGEVCHASLKTELCKLFPNARFRNIYASTESGSLFDSFDDTFVVPENLREMVRLDGGQLLLHASLIAESLRGNCIDSFYSTGDEVEIVNNNPLTLRVLGRKSDWINVGGFKINPHAIEAALVQIEGVVEARVFAQRNSVVGQLVCAEVVLASDVHYSVADIRRILSSRLDNYSIPRIIQFVNEIGILPSGKKGRAV